MRAPVPKESTLQKTVAEVLRDHLLPTWQGTHFPAGEHRNARTGARLKSFGLRPGWPDFILISPGGMFHALELKRPGGKLTVDQEVFREWCLTFGIPHAIAWTLDQALDALAKWQCLRIDL